MQRRVAFALGQVDDVGIGTGRGVRRDLIRVFGLQTRELARGHGRTIQLTRDPARPGGVFVVDGHGGDRRHDHVGGVPIGRAFLHHQLFADQMFGQHIGPVADIIAGLGPFVAMRVNGLLADREHRGMGQHLREIRQGRFDLDLQRQVVDGPGTQFGGGHFATGDGPGVHDLRQFQIPGIFRGQRRVGDALPGIDIIARRHRIAVGPFRLGPQVECIGGQVSGDVIGQSTGRNEGPCGVFVVKPFDQRADDVGILDRGGQIWVQRLGAVQHPVGIALIGGQFLARDRMRPGQRRKSQTKAQNRGCEQGSFHFMTSFMLVSDNVFGWGRD